MKKNKTIKTMNKKFVSKKIKNNKKNKSKRMKFFLSILNSNNNNNSNILDKTNIEAKNFFLQSNAYSTLEFPAYIDFSEILVDIANKIKNKKLSDIKNVKKDPKLLENINYEIMISKNAKSSWRIVQLINPLIYVALVNEITNKKNWNFIIERFKEFRKNKNINCVSIPLLNWINRNDNKVTILNWWEKIEQESLALGLDYSYNIQTDITNCYPTLNNYSIAWALHGKEFIQTKNNIQKKTLIGNKIVSYIQSMQNNKTTGIPQGTVLMHFIAEIVLEYADLKLSERLKKIKIKNSDYYILRYRDDYRIFTKSKDIGDKILREIVSILAEFGWYINPQKTIYSNNTIEKTLKTDKFFLLEKNIGAIPNIEKRLLAIYKFSLEFTNSGQLVRMLNDFYNYSLEIKELKEIRNLYIKPILSIILEIAYTNPRVQPVCCAIISKLLTLIENEKEKNKIFINIKNKLSNMQNNSYCEIWLQRLGIGLKNINIKYEENICKLLDGKIKLWNDSWCKKEYKYLLNSKKIISKDCLKIVGPIITANEIGSIWY